MYLVKTPLIAHRIYPSYIWNIPSDKKTIYLTFDDGPVPEATPWVLDQLERAGAKATFFCIGENVKKYPEIFQMVIDAGHVIGNHTQTHPSGWTTSYEAYLDNVDQASKLIDSLLFRPPYGRIKTSQAKALFKSGYKIIMWDILSGDFDASISPEKCYQNVSDNIESGSIVVFHDSVKSIDKLKAFLPQLLNDLLEEGFEFGTL